MGIAFTIDSPIRVSQYGISSVVSLVDDDLIEKMNKYYSEKFNLYYEQISNKIEDYRAKRITAYLNTMHEIVSKKVEFFKEELSTNSKTLNDFLTMLPQNSELKNKLADFIKEKSWTAKGIKSILNTYFKPGNIDVNIMTKLDKENFIKDEQLPTIYNDAHASLRGYANSSVSSSIIFSAGMNPKLYSYLETFEDFFPTKEGVIKKKVVLKVSDYRSALVQGSFLAKKGIWVSEYRIESGLNCGGHAFATNGILLGPILEEFKTNKANLAQTCHELLVKALEQKNKVVPEQMHDLIITVQGGVGDAEEQRLLLNHYEMDSVGWGSPFLLVPEATSLDEETRGLLVNAKEDDYYLSHISPLGIRFNAVKGTSNTSINLKRNEQGRYGSSCPKKYLALSKELTPKGTCTASKVYQDVKLAELELANLPTAQYEVEKSKIIRKSCLCVGLSNSALMDHDLPVKGEKQGVVVCPGPNLAYFSKVVSLKQMVQHIYGYSNVPLDANRPNFFLKELRMYIDYLKEEVRDFSEVVTDGQLKKWETFKHNILDGIAYYQSFFETTSYFKEKMTGIKKELDQLKESVCSMQFSAVELAI